MLIPGCLPTFYQPFGIELNSYLHTPLKYKLVFFLGRREPYIHGKPSFKIVTASRSRNDSANNSIYCNSFSNRGQTSQY